MDRLRGVQNFYTGRETGAYIERCKSAHIYAVHITIRKNAWFRVERLNGLQHFNTEEKLAQLHSIDVNESVHNVVHNTQHTCQLRILQ